MGRLEDIAERNRNPRATRRASSRRKHGVGLVGIVLFVALVLVLFTDLGTPTEDVRLPPPSGEVRGVDLGRPAGRVRSPRDAAASDQGRGDRHDDGRTDP